MEKNAEREISETIESCENCGFCTNSSAPIPYERTEKERYFVKPHFGPWSEVTKEQYQRFCENVRNGAVNMSETEKEAYIKTVTKITTE